MPTKPRTPRVRGALLVLLALGLSACAGTHLDRSARWGLDQSRALYVARPADDRYTSVFHENVGRAITLHYPNSLIGAREESTNAALASARFAGADYVFYPIVERSTARQGFWTGARRLQSMRRAVFDVRVLILDAHTGDLIETAVLGARGGLFQTVGVAGGGAASAACGLDGRLSASRRGPRPGFSKGDIKRAAHRCTPITLV